MLRLTSRSFCVLASAAVLVAIAPLAGATTVTGRVLDSTNGLPLAGDEVLVDGEATGLTTDAEGRFKAEVAEGERLFTFKRTGYSEQSVGPVPVPATGETAAPEAKLTPAAADDGVVMLDALEVTGNSEVKLQVENRAIQQETAATINIVGVEDFAKFAISDMSDALKTIPGVTVAEGKYAVIRGLSDRYTSTSLNGLPLASPDPDKQAVQLDIFPASLFENVVVSKTFTPDLPGTATGGVNMVLKSVPREAFVKASGSVGFHSTATGNENFLTNGRGTSDDRWASASDDRAIPETAKSFPENLDRPVWPLPTPPPPGGIFITAAQKAEAVAEAEAINRTLGSNYHTYGKKPGPDHGVKVSFGDRYKLGEGVEAGFVSGVNYNREYRMVEDAYYFRSSTATSGANSLSPDSFTDPDRAIGYRQQTRTESTVTSALSWLIAGGVELGENHSIRANRLNLQTSEDQNSRLLGQAYNEFPFSADGDQLDLRLNETLRYTERSLISDQIGGTHTFDFGGRFDRFSIFEANWALGHDLARQDEPGYVQSNATILDDGTLSIASSSNSPGTAAPSYVIWRRIEESRDNRRIDLAIKDEASDAFASAFKVGYLGSEAKRNVFDEYITLGGDNLADQSDTSLGNVNNTPETPGSSNDTRLATGYDVAADVDLFTESRGRYFMLDQKLFERFRVVGGYRYEENSADVRVNGQLQLRGAEASNPLASLPSRGGYEDSRWLPSITLTYQPNAYTNVRFAYSRTVALPSAREVSPYATSSFSGDDIEVGNLNLVPSEVENFDLGFSRFNEAGDLIGLAVFHKTVQSRIERLNGLNIALNPGGDPNDYGDYQIFAYDQNIGAPLFSWYNNPNESEIDGAEVEARKNLGFVGEGLEPFSVGGSLALIKGRVERFPIEIAAKNLVNRPVSRERGLTDQPKFLANVDLTYESEPRGLRVSLIYYRFGETLYSASLADSYDVYTAEYGSFDLTASKKLGKNFTLSASIKNLTDSERETFYDVEGSEVTRDRYKVGRAFSISGTFDF